MSAKRISKTRNSTATVFDDSDFLALIDDMDRRPYGHLDDWRPECWVLGHCRSRHRPSLGQWEMGYGINDGDSLIFQSTN